MSGWRDTAWTQPAKPYAIAHRGASAYAPDCSLEAYQKASRLGADMWEVDIRRAKCGTLITYHDRTLPDGTGIADLTAVEIAELAVQHDVPAVPFAEVVALAVQLGAGIYADIKDTAASVPVMEMIRDAGIEKAVLGAFDPDAAAILRRAGSPYPSSALVPLGADPFEHAKGADVIHLCWERMERPQDMLDAAFFAKVAEIGLLVVLWHEEDPARMAALRDLPILGICSDRPELVHPWKAPAVWDVQIVAHRGGTEFAPENTLEAAQCAFAAGFDFVELDVRQAMDGQIVLHDATLERTTNGSGLVKEMSASALAALDAGSWYTPHFNDQHPPLLSEMLKIARLYQSQLYIELKDAEPEDVLNTVALFFDLESCFFWSENINLLGKLRGRSPAAKIMLRVQDFPSVADLLARKPDIVEVTLNELTAPLLATLRDAGAKVMVAYMGCDENTFDSIIEMRPDMVNLHFPFQFRTHLAKRGLV